MALRIALSGFVVLVVAMGIGRFAFTPQVPLMIAAGQLTLTSAGLVAAMNYLGYLVGAWDAMRAHRFVETRLWLGITGAVALTLLSAAADNAVVHGLLRFVIGCMSGWSMVLIAAWSNERLGQLGKPGLSAAVFAGPGAGIALSGLLAVYIQAKSLSAGAAWQIYGVLALVLVALVARYLPRSGQLHRPGSAPEPLLLTTDLKRLVWSYSLAGFGYILPATFLSQMAAVRFPGSLFAQFVWPIFGAAAVVGIALSILLRHTSTANRRLAIVLWLQGGGRAGGLAAAGHWRLADGRAAGGRRVPLRGAALSFIRPRAGTTPHALYGGAAHHRVCHRAIGGAGDLGVINLANPPAGACAGAGWRCAVCRRCPGLESPR